MQHMLRHMQKGELGKQRSQSSSGDHAHQYNSV